MMLFRNSFIIAAQATLFLSLSSVSTVSAAPVPQLFQWLHVMPVEVPTSLMPTTTEGVTISRPTPTASAAVTAIATGTGIVDVVGTPTNATDSGETNSAATTSAEPSVSTQTSGALSALTLNNKLALGSSALALAFLAL